MENFLPLPALRTAFATLPAGATPAPPQGFRGEVDDAELDLWSHFDGCPDRFNIAHECLDRHYARGVAICLQHRDGRSESLRFDELADDSARFAHWLIGQGQVQGDQVAILASPSRAFYVALFGALRAGLTVWPVSPGIGPEALTALWALWANTPPHLVLTEAPAENGALDVMPSPEPSSGLRVRALDGAFWRELQAQPRVFDMGTCANSVAFRSLSQTPGSPQLEFRLESHGDIVGQMAAGIYGLGLEPGDRFFSLLASTHPRDLLLHTLVPLAMGVRVCHSSAVPDAQSLLAALEALQINNLFASPEVFRSLRASGQTHRYRLGLRKLSFSGPGMDLVTAAWIEQVFGVAPACLYGSPDHGIVLVQFPGFEGHEIRPMALGKPLPGRGVTILNRRGSGRTPFESGEIAVSVRGVWVALGDRGWCDGDGYFYREAPSADRLALPPPLGCRAWGLASGA